jgi:hypothetical protein
VQEPGRGAAARVGPPHDDAQREADREREKRHGGGEAERAEEKRTRPGAAQEKDGGRPGRALPRGERGERSEAGRGQDRAREHEEDLLLATPERQG